MGSARRFGMTLRGPRLEGIEAVGMALTVFAGSRPERQADAEQERA
jgi:predicted branched-subunit amino acid permease